MGESEPSGLVVNLMLALNLFTSENKHGSLRTTPDMTTPELQRQRCISLAGLLYPPARVKSF